MLTVEIDPDGGVDVAGTGWDLGQLVMLIVLAQERGSARTTFVSDRAKAWLTVRTLDEEQATT